MWIFTVITLASSNKRARPSGHTLTKMLLEGNWAMQPENCRDFPKRLLICSGIGNLELHFLFQRFKHLKNAQQLKDFPNVNVKFYTLPFKVNNDSWRKCEWNVFHWCLKSAAWQAHSCVIHETLLERFLQITIVINWHREKNASNTEISTHETADCTCNNEVNISNHLLLVSMKRNWKQTLPSLSERPWIILMKGESVCFAGVLLQAKINTTKWAVSGEIWG